MVLEAHAWTAYADAYNDVMKVAGEFYNHRFFMKGKSGFYEVFIGWTCVAARARCQSACALVVSDSVSAADYNDIVYACECGTPAGTTMLRDKHSAVCDRTVVVGSRSGLRL